MVRRWAQSAEFSTPSRVDDLNAALPDIAAAGPAPVNEGPRPQVSQVLVTTLSKLRDALAAGSAELDAVPQNQRDDTLMYTLTGVTSLPVPADGRTLLDLVRPISLESAIRRTRDRAGSGAGAGRSVWCSWSRSAQAARSPR